MSAPSRFLMRVDGQGSPGESSEVDLMNDGYFGSEEGYRVLPREQVA